MALHAYDDDTDVLLTSRVYEPTVVTRDSAVGFGSVALKFVNRQPVIGFDLELLPDQASGKPLIQVRFFSIDGELLGKPTILSGFGRYTFATVDHQQKIKGIEFVNFGSTPFGVDHVVFVLPLIMG